MITKSREVRFEISTICNYSCELCAIGKMTRRREIMPTALFKMLLEKIQRETGNQFRYLDFSGMGEPLMDRDIASKIGMAKDAKMHTILVTNGSLLTAERFLELQSQGLNYVRVSMHGADSGEYSRKHGVDDDMYVKVSKNLREILKVPRQTRVGIHFTLIDARQDTVAKIKKDWKDADITEIWKPHNWADAYRYREVQADKIPCSRIEKGPLQVQVDGMVNACCFDYDGKTILGDLKTQSLEEIFAGAGYTGICRSCDQRNADKSTVLVYSSVKDPERLVKTSSGFVKFD